MNELNVHWGEEGEEEEEGGIKEYKSSNDILTQT